VLPFPSPHFVWLSSPSQSVYSPFLSSACLGPGLPDGIFQTKNPKFG
jgi:hypothetical protein